MNLNCPHCQQNLEIDEALVGQTVDCPSCHQSLTVPAIPPPPLHVPLAPVSPGSTGASKKRKGCGCETIFWLLILLAAAAFGYAMYRFHESPKQVWMRMMTVVERYT